MKIKCPTCGEIGDLDHKCLVILKPQEHFKDFEDKGLVFLMQSTSK